MQIQNSTRKLVDGERHDRTVILPAAELVVILGRPADPSSQSHGIRKLVLQTPLQSSAMHCASKYRGFDATCALRVNSPYIDKW